MPDHGQKIRDKIANGIPMNFGFFIAQKQEDGSPGRPVGNEDGAIMMFEDLDVAKGVRDNMQEEGAPLAIFKVNLVYAGEVLA